MAVRTLAQARECRAEMLPWTQHHRSFAIVVDDHCVGAVSLAHVEWRHQTGWFSYFSSATVRGRGLVRRSASAVSTWALSELGLFRLELGHRVNNPASAAVAAAAGFRREGLERAKLRDGEDRFDVATWARLATDPAPQDPGPVELVAPDPMV